MGIHRATVKRAIKNPEQKYHMNVDRDKPVNGDFEKRPWRALFQKLFQ